MRSLLLPVSWLYGGVVALRNRAFETGFLRVQRVPVPVIAVGNLTAGGTGKTPLVKYLARLLTGMGRQVAVVSRGYGRSTTGPLVVADGRSVLVDGARGGDEPVELARAVPGLRVVVAERRVAGARVAVEECGADVILLDDAFQHRAIHRDLNILVLESGRPIGATALLPVGMRREPCAGIRRADLVAWSGAAEGWTRDTAAASLAEWFGGPVIGFRTSAGRMRRLSDPGGGPVACGGRRVLAFCGIGNPERFFASVEELGPAAVTAVPFADHHRYRPEEIDGLIRRFRESHADLFVTTEKDAARLDAVEEIRENFLHAYPVCALGAEVQIVAGERELEEAIKRALASR